VIRFTASPRWPNLPDRPTCDPCKKESGIRTNTRLCYQNLQKQVKHIAWSTWIKKRASAKGSKGFLIHFEMLVQFQSTQGTYSVKIRLWVFWEVKIDDHIHSLDVNAPCKQICNPYKESSIIRVDCTMVTHWKLTIMTNTISMNFGLSLLCHHLLLMQLLLRPLNAKWKVYSKLLENFPNIETKEVKHKYNWPTPSPQKER
jgi:hypothetical protein